MFKTLKRILVVLILVLFGQEINATHLVGGSMSYQYVGISTTGNVRYKVRLTLYRDCNTSGGTNGEPVPFDDEINICVYDNFGTKNLRVAPSFSLISERKVDPLGRTDCPQTQEACLRQGIYERIIDLPRSNFGYILFWERCCRNDINNLTNQGTRPFQGQSYQATIPPTTVINSSPFFTGVPVPFICVNDTTELNNFATDPDGDDLEYRLVTPWTGAEDDPVPGCNSRYSAPDNVQYRAGYGTAVPYGAGGVSNINQSNGLTTFFSKETGKFAVAVEVIERRNGVELSRVRLELQILVINCPPNQKPVFSGGDNQSYTIDAGELLCFNVTSTDADLHNIQLTGSGDVLDGTNAFTGNKATFTSRTARASVTSQFCWQSQCIHASNTPYLVSFLATDDGCPSKFKIINVSINVRPFDSDIGISGPTSVCENSINNIYSASNRVANSVLKWTASANGTITSADNLSNVRVDWNGGTTGKLYLTEVSSRGCEGSMDSITVNLIPTPPAPIINGSSDVCQNSTESYTIVNREPGATILWRIENGSILSGQGTTSVNINWGSKGSARLWATQTNSAGCESDSGILDVTIHKPDPPTPIGVQSICPYIQNVPYTILQPISNYTYAWSVQPNGVIDFGQGSDSITVDWGPLSTNYISVIAFDQFGCPSDPDSIRVDVEYALDGEVPTGEVSVCENDEETYFVRFTPKSVYRWNVSGGTIIEGDTGNIIKVRWGVAGPGQISIIEESFDSLNNAPCISLPNILNVTIHPLPVADDLNGIFEICQNAGTTTPITINGFANSSYIWRINGDSTGILGQGSNTIQFPLDAEGSFNVSVLEVTEFGCTRAIVDSIMIVQPKPRTSPINGPAIVCFPNYSSNAYNVTGFATSTFEWFVDDGIEVPSPSNTSSTVVNWNGRPLNTIKVLETSDFGCLGDTQILDVFLDRPSIKFDVVTVNPPPGADNQMRVYWTLNNGPRYNNVYEVQRRVAGTNGPFVTVGTVPHPQDSFIETPINTDINAFEYRVRGYDLCNQTLLTDTHTNILLQGTKDGPYEVSLGFSAYKGWASGVSKYDLFRYLPGKTGWELDSTFNDVENNISLSNGLDNYSQCYRIRATKQTSSGQDTFSWSNEVCFNFEPVVWIPNAFTINKDGLNDDFRVVTGAIKTIEISVFNRWGELLYKTNDPNLGWNGTYKGNDCPVDVYMYLVKFTGFDDTLYTQSGTLHLLR
jgi:gliding motility-associated-like protein